MLRSSCPSYAPGQSAALAKRTQDLDVLGTHHRRRYVQ
jgi:hypothetical protein